MTEGARRADTHRAAMGHRGPGSWRGTRIERARDIPGTTTRLLKYLLPYRTLLLLIAGLVIVSSALTVAGPLLIGRAVDEFSNHGKLAHVASVALAAYLLNWLCTALQGYLTASMVQKVLFTLRGDLFEHLQTLSLRFFDLQPHGELMSRLTNDIEAINRALGQSVTQLLSDVLILGGVLAAMFALNFRLALGSLLVLPLMLWLTLDVGRRTRGAFRALQEQLGHLNGLMEETISGARVVKAFAQEGAALAAFQFQNRATRDISIRATTSALIVMPMMTVLSNADIAVVAGLGGWLALRGLASTGTILAFISYARQFAQPLRQLSGLYNSVQAAIAGAERVFEIMDERPDLQDTPSALPLDGVTGDVRFEDVSFAYVPGVPVLHNVSLHAPAGRRLALVGPTGAGKTTIVNLLSRFYDVGEGHIRVDGRDLREIRISSLRRALGIVLQDTYLFSGTVLDNIRYGRLEATDEECIDAARLANADQFIRRLPDGYHTALSERAGNLSQGQRQLLAIARAILSKPAILVLDEATSSVDTRTELHTQEALERLMSGRTSFVIAHRLSTIRHADLVLVINEGRIIERGTHEELLALGGFYHDLYMSQFRGTMAPDGRTTQLSPNGPVLRHSG